MRTTILQLSTRAAVVSCSRSRARNNSFRQSAMLQQQAMSNVSQFSSSTTANVETDQSQAGSTTDNNNHDMNYFKTRLAQAAMKQVPTHGWTVEAITAAVIQDPKLSISMSGMLTPTDLVHWFMDDMNRQLRELKQGDSNASASSDKEKVFQSIQWRLQQVIPLVQCGQWHKGMAIGMSTPLTTKAQLHDFIEIISPLNVSTEYQAALGAIFVATELHLLTDSSADYQDTWTFLEQWLDDLEEHKDGNPAQLVASVFPSANPLDTGIPFMASMAVASSLLEGAASLLMPSNGSSYNVAGTKASDYNNPSSQ